MASVKQARAEGEAERTDLKHELTKARATVARERADAAAATALLTEERDALKTEGESLAAKLSVAEDRARIVEEKMNSVRDRNDKDVAKLRQLQTAQGAEMAQLEQVHRIARFVPMCSGRACRLARRATPTSEHTPLPFPFSSLLLSRRRARTWRRPRRRATS